MMLVMLVMLVVGAVQGGLGVLHGLSGHILFARVGLLLLILRCIVVVPYGQLWTVGISIAHDRRSMGLGVGMSMSMSMSMRVCM